MSESKNGKNMDAAPGPLEEGRGAKTQKTALDPIHRFLNIWLVTIAAFGAGGLLVGTLLVWPHDYLERGLPGVLLSTVQAQLGGAVSNAFIAGIWVAVLIMISRKLGGRFRIRLVPVGIMIAVLDAYLTYVTMQRESGGTMLGARIAIRWRGLGQVLRSVVHLGMEEELFRHRLIRVTILGIAGVVSLLVVHLSTRRLLGRIDSDFRKHRPSKLATPLAFIVVFGMLVTLGRTATDDIKPGVPDVIFISLDTLRADHLSCYGYGRETSPRLDEFARDGILVENCISHAPWTLPSHASMFTGLLPFEHGAVEPQIPLNPRIDMFPEVLKQRGYRTGGFVTGILVSPGFGFNRGFDIYTFHDGYNAARNTADAVTWFMLHRAPSFLFLHLFDLHYPYRPPKDTYTRFGPATPFFMLPQNSDFGKFLAFADRDPSHAAEAAVDRYDELILYLDIVLGRLFEKLRQWGRYDNTLIIVTSDHGEEFYDHGSWGHSQYLYDESVHVPLIIKLPGNACKGIRLKDALVPLKSIDYLILEATSRAWERNPALQCGPDGLPDAVRSMTQTEPVLSETQFSWLAAQRGAHRFAARSLDQKLLEPYSPADPRLSHFARGWELYDLRKDPAERLNMYEPGAAPELERDLATANRRFSEKTGVKARGPELDRATMERLRSLGYLQ